MARLVLLVLGLSFVAGCSQTIRTTTVGENLEVEVHDDGAMALVNASQLHRDWEEVVQKLCPRGSVLLGQQYFKEEPFKAARLVGIVSCK